MFDRLPDPTSGIEKPQFSPLSDSEKEICKERVPGDAAVQKSNASFGKLTGKKISSEKHSDAQGYPPSSSEVRKIEKTYRFVKKVISLFVSETKNASKTGKSVISKFVSKENWQQEAKFLLECKRKDLPKMYELILIRYDLEALGNEDQSLFGKITPEDRLASYAVLKSDGHYEVIEPQNPTSQHDYAELANYHIHNEYDGFTAIMGEFSEVASKFEQWYQGQGEVGSEGLEIAKAYVERLRELDPEKKLGDEYILSQIPDGLFKESMRHYFSIH